MSNSEYTPAQLESKTNRVAKLVQIMEPDNTADAEYYYRDLVAQLTTRANMMTAQRKEDERQSDGCEPDTLDWRER